VIQPDFSYNGNSDFIT